ncbi:MAG TPA: hemerythrin family protein [Patescibacteria group bacterium]|nr:hemerythrin family protein [Patescibacteria group bacterium]
MGDRTIHWTQALSVGIPALDDDHKTLIDMLGRIFAVCRAEGNHVQLSLLIDKMLDHVHHHFDHEEEIMADARYPDLHRHLDEHAKLFIQLSEVLHAIRNDPAHGANEDIRAFLRTMLFNHIEHDDRRCADYIRDAASAPKRGDAAHTRFQT